jgi:hypothetical protein
MPRLMAVPLAGQQVRDRTKTVTRRPGWRMLRIGDHLTLCKKVMGRRHVESLDRITGVEATGIRRERLDAIILDDLTAGGFPGMTPGEHAAFFGEARRGCTPETAITPIQWRYTGETKCPNPRT